MSIDKLQNDLKELAKQKEVVETELQSEYNKIFNANPRLLEIEARASDCEKLPESGYQYTQDGVEYWCRFEALADFTDVKGYIENWFSDHGLHLDWDNNAVMNFQGGCFVITPDGDVYDTDASEVIVRKIDYSDTKERNQLIERHMERTGYFPGVFRDAFNGELIPVDTTQTDSDE